MYISCYNAYSESTGRDKATDALRQLVDPTRHSIHLSDVDVPSAVREIQRLFDWTPGETYSNKSITFLKDIRVTIDRNSASLAEILADLCSQTGLHTYKVFENIGIYGGIGHEEIGGRGLTFAKDGVLLLLSFNSRLSFIESAEPKTYRIFPCIVTAIPWLYNSYTQLRLDEIVYPDGTRLDNLGEKSIFFNIPFEPLVRNHGCIDRIRGLLTIYLPVSVVSKELPFIEKQIPFEEQGTNHFLRVTQLDRTDDGWTLSVEYGYFSSKEDDGSLYYGDVKVLDTTGSVMQGNVKVTGGGTHSSGEWKSRIYEEFQSFEIDYPVRPFSVRWTYAEVTEEYRIPVLFTNCRVPDIIWNSVKKKSQETP